MNAAIDALAEGDIARTGTPLAPAAVPPTCTYPLTSQLGSEVSTLPHPPSLRADETHAIPHAILSSAVVSVSDDAFPGSVGPSCEATVLAVASNSMTCSHTADPPHLPAHDVHDGDGPVEACRLQGSDQAAAHSLRMSLAQHGGVSGEQDASSPHSSCQHSWVTAPEPAATGSSCGGSLAEFDPMVLASPQSPRSVSTVPLAMPTTNHSIVPQILSPTYIAEPTALPLDDGAGDSSLVSAELPRGDLAITDASIAYSAVTSTLSRISAANSQARLLQSHAGIESISPSHPSSPFTVASLPAAAGQSRARTPDRARLELEDAGSMPQLSTDTERLSGPRSCRVASGPHVSTSNPLYRPLQHYKSGRQQRQGSATADTPSSSSAATLKPAGSLLKRTGSSLKRALVRSLHTVKSFARTPSDPHPAAGSTLGSCPPVGAQPLQRRSFVPQSTLFRSIQQSIQSITDGDGEHCDHTRTGPDIHRTGSPEVPQVVAGMSQSRLRPALPDPAHRADLEPLVPPAGLHTPHSRATSAQSQLLPPSPAALVGSQLSESASSQAQSATDASPALMSPGHGAHLVTPGRVSVVHGQQVGNLIETADCDGRVQSAPLRSWAQHHGQCSTNDQRVQGRRHVSSLRRRSALAACFCGMLDQDRVEFGAGTTEGGRCTEM